MRGARTSDYDFALPAELIAQSPPDLRGDSRLMVVDRAANTISHCAFVDIVDLVPSGDLVVRNTTRVMRARLLGVRDSGAPAEVLLLKALGDSRYEAMVRPGGKIRPGRSVHVGEQLAVRVLETTERRTRIVELVTELADAAAIERYGHMPLPPYITRSDAPPDAERYQTVYANVTGSAAAPTAGLHFTDAIINQLLTNGVSVADVLLHVGAGTFKPVEVDDPAEHVMHEEWYEISPVAAAAIRAARERGAKVWAVGTTTVRTLESAADESGQVRAGSGDTDIFIRPPQALRAVDHLLTNFHLPNSTLIMLVAAFAGYDLTMRAYREAVEERYRFFSYGDAMLIL
ncbi:MAG: tRNA preQ1(34) S-adenosylmethionine ribosyltransferase-isomerase QueA [Gemmatimonadota bacterium]|nr:tRNA preQ1(34) S-adenosylmethionine ribosyltransferase-isomerase QueA [Gemmatimonadota bacterium]